MKSVIVFRDGRRVSLASAVDSSLYAELENTHSPRKDPLLFCGGCGGGIFIQHGRRDRAQLYGYHHTAGDCTETFKISRPMSDEHKRQAEYHALAAERAGHSADFEVTMTGRTRVDVVVDGRIGFEIQHSALGKAAAIDRTARSVAGGLQSVAWCTDREKREQWTGYVPGYRTTLPGAAWKALPRPRSAGAVGIATFEVGERPALVHGRIRMERAPRRVLVPMLIDDVVPAIAEGLIRPVPIGSYIWLVRAEGIALWEELTGRPIPAYDAGRPKVRTLAPSQEARCFRPVVAIPAVTACTWCHQPFDQEAIRFRISIHPHCADERATAEIQNRYAPRASALCRGSVLMTHSTRTLKSC